MHMINLQAVSQVIVPGLLNARYLSSVALRKPRGESCKFNISTLDPQRLVTSDFIDIGDKTHITVLYRNVGVIYRRYDLIYPRTTYNVYQPFPPGTHGYLYLHRIPDVHPAASTIRFRICDKDLPPLESFSRGRDLVAPKSMPWQINIWQLMGQYRNENISDCLVLDQVISAEVVQQLHNFESLNKRNTKFRLHSPPILSFRQPFSIMMNQKTSNLRFVGLDNHILWHVKAKTSIMEDLPGEGKLCTMCLDYNPHGRSYKDRIVFRILQIPQELRGKTRYNEGDIMPFRIATNCQPKTPLHPTLLDTLIRQSPSLSSAQSQS
ncbi:hypothetical protein BDP27DRAFT_1333455 [Rhodocollybia butyracea]|uniref:Uncharacterized protein n=1 Tax=Rhodocollybia butyracea TaxID=206335 RepID=A0A9P5U3D6_9AGAR|nr:hypothetical protein BDP27DRAFT_1333455 [Rhodocollybia butyracea]